MRLSNKWKVDENLQNSEKNKSNKKFRIFIFLTSSKYRSRWLITQTIYNANWVAYNAHFMIGHGLRSGHQI